MLQEIVPTEMTPNNIVVHPNYDAILKEVGAQASNPPGGDPYMREFYAAVFNMATPGSNTERFISQVLDSREVSPKHFVNLLFRGVQFIEINNKRNPNYPKQLDTREEWQVEMEDILANHADTLLDIVLTKETSTTIYQRYLGTQFVAAKLLQGSGLKIADFGAGGRYGLRGISVGAPFEEVNDNTGGIVNAITTQRIDLREGLDIDLVDPDLPDNIRWRLACSFYPSELDRYNQVVAFEAKLREVKNVRFFQRDILSVTIDDLSGNTIPHSYDAVVLSTVLYQIPEYQQKVIDNAKQLVSPTGFIIVQDFAVKDGNDGEKLDFNVNWFGKNYAYRTFIIGERTNWRYKEVLQWANGRCKDVRAGEDFEEVLYELGQSNK